MSTPLSSHRILLIAFAAFALAMLSSTIYFRVEEQKLIVQNRQLLSEIHNMVSPKNAPNAGRFNRPSVLFDTPVTEKTALSFFWFGDMDSHFRNPVNFFVVKDADHQLHKVQLTDFVKDDQANVFVSEEEMERILKAVKALDLSWYDSSGRKKFESAGRRRGTGMLDITLVDLDRTGEAHIRIAEMCNLLDRLDSTMPTPRILWQFRTFRWDNGCEIPGYENHSVPAE
jgi:hypothetical protein